MATRTEPKPSTVMATYCSIDHLLNAFESLSDGSSCSKRLFRVRLQKNTSAA